MSTFSDLGLQRELVDALAQHGITRPFPIQSATIEAALAGRDVCGKAKTGSGKTLAFGLPLLQRTERATKGGHPTALVLVPTRELAAQVLDDLGPLADAIGLRATALYGGTTVDKDIKRLKAGIDVAVATPGRLIDLVERGVAALTDVAIVVIDEADRMADMGFLPQVDWLLRRLGERRKQAMLFSATLDSDVDVIVRRHLHDPVLHEVGAETVSVEDMIHRFLAVHQMDRVRVLASIARNASRTIAFSRTKRGVDRLVSDLKVEGVKVQGIHGDLRQRNRERALADFEAGKIELLVATDVAARGIHIDDIDTVVHFDPPEDHKAYLHRSGRTARAGRAGTVATFVLWDQHLHVDRLKKRLGLTEPTVEVFSNDARLTDLARFSNESDDRTLAS